MQRHRASRLSVGEYRAPASIALVTLDPFVCGTFKTRCHSDIGFFCVSAGILPVSEGLPIEALWKQVNQTNCKSNQNGLVAEMA
jgi:hypothetical protein